MSDEISLQLDNTGQQINLLLADALPPQSLTLTPNVSNIELSFAVTQGVGAMGASGYSGYSGLNGNDGNQGASGYSGFSGISISGFSGSTGLQGVSGYSGRSGYSGFSGIGLSGYSGFSGINGTNGTNGINGASGFSGINGNNGSNGNSGYSGYSGINGSAGSPGAAGVSGFSGLNGTTGQSGYSGYSGLNGNAGATGSTGQSGFSGFSGTNGINGLNGTSGFSEYSGSSSSGYSGFSGNTGATGSIGASGFSGFSGLNGNAGTSGWSGYIGANGLQGQSGYSGYSGSNGNSGYSGYSGNSTSGYSGFSGSSSSGYSGFSGSTGNAGTSGYSGYSGTAATVGGSTTQIQYNNAGALAGSANHTWDSTNLVDTVTTPTSANTIYPSFIAQNTAAASSGNQMYGGFYYSNGAGWKVNGPAASQATIFRWGTVSVQGSGAATANWTLQSNINAAGWVTNLSISDTGIMILNSDTYTGALTLQLTANNTVKWTGPTGDNITIGPSNRIFINSTMVVQNTSGFGTTPGGTAFVETAASTTAIAALKINTGVAPTSPSNGMIWETSSHLYGYINGATYQLDQQLMAGYKRTTVADTAYTTAITDTLVAYTSLTAARSVTLTTTGLTTGQPYIIKDESGNAGSFNITITGATGNIDGAANKTITTAYGIIRLYWNGSNFYTW